MTDLAYRAIWWREIEQGVNGQHPDKPSTWKYDALWRAATLQYAAEETQRMLQEVIDRDAHVDVIKYFADRLEADIAACHAMMCRGLDAAA